MGAKRPNLIFILADALRYRSVGYNGDTQAKTPNIDMLAQCSAVMENCFSNHPLESPYFASMLTGKYTTSTGIVANSLSLNPQQRTIAHILTDNGYNTEFIGRWSLSPKKECFIPQGENRLGFDSYFASFEKKRRFNQAVFTLDTKDKIKTDKYESDLQTELAVERIEENAKSNSPFALFVSYALPGSSQSKRNIAEKYTSLFKDTQFSLPKNYDGVNDPYSDRQSKASKTKRKKLTETKKLYYAMVSNIDENIGRIMQSTVETGIDDNTIIVFTSNCGELFGAHGRIGKNIFFDEAVRVPFIIRYSNLLATGKNESCLGTVDIMPTLLGLMNIDIPDSVQGTDKSRYMLSGKSDSKGQLLMGTGPAEGFGPSKEWRAYRTKEFTYAVYKSDNEEFLFDNLNDPLQTINLIYDKNYIDIGKRIKDEMYAEMAAINDSFESNAYYKKHWIKNKKVIAQLK